MDYEELRPELCHCNSVEKVTEGAYRCPECGAVHYKMDREVAAPICIGKLYGDDEVCRAVCDYYVDCRNWGSHADRDADDLEDDEA